MGTYNMRFTNFHVRMLRVRALRVCVHTHVYSLRCVDVRSFVYSHMNRWKEREGESDIEKESARGSQREREGTREREREIERGSVCDHQAHKNAHMLINFKMHACINM